LNGSHTEGSPAQRVPLPGYVVDKVGNDSVKISYKVVRAVNASDNTKFDYTADWYYFDDQGDSTPFPADAASLKVKKIEYHRAPEYLTYYNSFVLPFEFTQAMKGSIDTSAKIYNYKQVTDNKVIFEEDAQNSVAAGTPFILYCNSDTVNLKITKDDGTEVVMAVTNATNADGIGLLGSFNTIETGWGYWKIDDSGYQLVKTVGKSDASDKPSDAPANTNNPISHCYPYRAYLKLPSTQNSSPVKEYIPCFIAPGEIINDDIIEKNNKDDRYYNLMGQQVSKNAKGITIVGGKKRFVK